MMRLMETQRHIGILIKVYESVLYEIILIKGNLNCYHFDGKLFI